MRGYYSGDTERDDYDKIQRMDTKSINTLMKDNSLRRAPTADYNYQVIRRKTTFHIDEDKARKDAENLIAGDGNEIKENDLLFKKKSVNIFTIYCHFFEPLDWLYLVLAIIGSVGSGISMPIMTQLTSEVYSDIGNTAEYTTPEEIEESNVIVDDTMDNQIKKNFIYGAASFVVSFFCTAFWSLIGDRCVYNLKRKYFALILAQEQAWFDENNAFEFSTKVQTQIDQINGGIGEPIGSILLTICQCIIGFVFAFMASWKLTLVMLCSAPVILFFTLFILKVLKKGIILARMQWESAGGIAEEMLYNIKTVASFVNFEYELKKFYEKVEICYHLDLINACKLGFSIGFVIFFLNLCIFIGFIYGRTLINKDINSNRGRDFRSGDVVTASTCTLMAITGVGLLAPTIQSIQVSCAAASDYFNIYERKPKMDLSQSKEKPPLDSIQGLIEFKKVSFYYPSDPSKRIILNEIDLVFEPGKKVAIVGESGCGKSTTVNLIERLYDISGGDLLIDGLDIKKYDIQYLRSFIGYVQQEPVLFNNTIRDNIVFGREEQLQSMGDPDQLIKEACYEAYADEFINKIPEGLDYKVGVKGGKLSGGQKQRIAIARAILTKPKILILDEATSALDNKSEKEVQKALDNISKKSITTIIIAHRLSTIKNADLIYACKEGKVLEKGTHKELLAKGGYYAGLVKSQLAQDEIETQNKIEEIERKTTNTQRRLTEEEVQFENREKEISLKEEDIKVKPCNVIRELCDYKLNIGLACLGAIILGTLSPVNGFIVAKVINALNSRYQTIRYDDGLKYACIYLAISFLQGVGNCLMIWKFASLGESLSRIYRKKLINKYLSFHLSYFDLTNNSPGSLMTRMSLDTTKLNDMINSTLGVACRCGAVLIVGLIIGCYYEYRLTLVDFCFVPFIVGSNLLRRGLLEGSSKKAREANIEAGGILSECVINTKTIFSFNFQPTAIKLYLNALEYTRKQFYRDAFISGFFVALGGFASFAANSAIYALSRKYIMDRSIESDEMVIAMSVVTTCSQGVSNGLSGLGNLRTAYEGYRSIYKVLETPTTINPFPKENENKISANNIKGKIELRHVYFVYPTRPDNVILKDVSLTINPGEHVAFVGYSGSGKSTIIQLLNRFYDVEDGKGEILIDDVNIKDYNLYELRKKIGLVSQEPTLFKIPAIENVRYGRLTATDEECMEAAKEANITKLLASDKKNEIIGENNEGEGENLETKKVIVSGGEKQRLAIARVFLKNPSIILLDEATSALDKDNELEVQKSLDRLCVNRTSVNIAHRLSTIEGSDKIFVFENGRLVEQGNHQQLMKLKRKYYTLQKYSNSS